MKMGYISTIDRLIQIEDGLSPLSYFSLLKNKGNDKGEIFLPVSACLLFNFFVRYKKVNF